MKTVMGIFKDTASADMAFTELVNAGFSQTRISAISKDMNAEKTETKGAVQNAVGGGAAGAMTGGAIGGVAGLLMAAGVLALPGIGPLLIGGPLIAALGLSGGAATTAAGALTGAAAGGLIGGLTGLGLPESTAKVYSERIAGGSIVLSVDVDPEEEQEAVDILERNTAEDVVTAGK